MYFHLTPEGGAVASSCEVAEILKSKKKKEVKKSLLNLVVVNRVLSPRARILPSSYAANTSIQLYVLFLQTY